MALNNSKLLKDIIKEQEEKKKKQQEQTKNAKLGDIVLNTYDADTINVRSAAKKNAESSIGSKIYQRVTDTKYDYDTNSYVKQNTQTSNGKKLINTDAKGSVLGNIAGTVGDVGLHLLKGGVNAAENISDLASYIVAGGADLLGQKEYAKTVREGAKESFTDALFRTAEKSLNDYSYSGDFFDSVAQSLGESYANAQVSSGFLKGINDGNIPIGKGKFKINMPITSLVSGLSSGMSEAYNNGATNFQSIVHGVASGIAEGVGEGFFGMFGMGGSSLEKSLMSKFTSNLENSLARRMVQTGISGAGEGLEEVITYFMNYGFNIAEDELYDALGIDGTRMAQEFSPQEILENLAAGTLSGLIGASTSNFSKSGKQYEQAIHDTEKVKGSSLTETETEKVASILNRANSVGVELNGQEIYDRLEGNTKAEQEVIDALVSRQVNEKTTEEEKQKIIEQVNKDIDEGKYSGKEYIEILGGENSTKIKEYNQLTQEINELETQIKEAKDGITPQSEIKKLETELKTKQEQLNNIDINQVLNDAKKNALTRFDKDSRLMKSFQEDTLRSQKLQYNTKGFRTNAAKATIENALNSNLNNSTETRNLINTMANISETDKVPFYFVSNEDIKNNKQFQKILQNGDTINGYVYKDGIAVNIDSPSALQFVIGHEVTHLFENTELYQAYKTLIKEYASENEDIQKRIDKLQKSYEKQFANLSEEERNTKIENELISDLTGEYLFNDQEFINRLYAKDKKGFAKLVEWVKNLLSKLTKGTKQYNQVNELKSKLDQAKDAYIEMYKNETAKTPNETELSVISTKGAKRLKKNNSNYYNELYNQSKLAIKMAKNGYNNKQIKEKTNWYFTKNGDLVTQISDYDIKQLHDFEKNSKHNLSYYLDAPLLYEAYPNLKNIPVNIYEFKGNNSNAFYRERSRSIHINQSKIEDLTISNLLHEVNHYIQHRDKIKSTGANGILEDWDTYINNLGEIMSNETQIYMDLTQDELNKIFPESAKLNPNGQKVYDEKMKKKDYNYYTERGIYDYETDTYTSKTKKEVMDYEDATNFEKSNERKNNSKLDTNNVSFSISGNTIEDKINQSFTMQDVDKMIEMAFRQNGIKDFYDDKYTNGKEWLEGEGIDDVVMYLENTEIINNNYINPLYSKDKSFGDYYTLEDILEAYQNNTLTGKVKNRKNLDTSKDTGYIDNRFYAPKDIIATKEMYDIANQRVTNNNRDEVYKARADFIIAMHNTENMENFGIDRNELNKKVKSWANYPTVALDLSNKLNDGVSKQNQWSGLENSSIVNAISISNEEMQKMVKEVKGDSVGYQRQYITSTMLALDTHIDYSKLTIEFDKTNELRQKGAAGDYDHRTDTIRIGNGYQNTVAHEIGHYIDYQWLREITGSDKMMYPLSEYVEGSYYWDLLTDEQKQFVNNFNDFIAEIRDSATLGTGSRNVDYYQKNTEVFARFVGKFTEWVKNTATNGRYGYDEKFYKDNFTQSQYMKFVKILQEKASLDTSNKQDITMSISNDIAPYNTNLTYGKDIQVQEETPDIFELLNKSLIDNANRQVLIEETNYLTQEEQNELDDLESKDAIGILDNTDRLEQLRNKSKYGDVNYETINNTQLKKITDNFKGLYENGFVPSVREFNDKVREFSKNGNLTYKEVYDWINNNFDYDRYVQTNTDIQEAQQTIRKTPIKVSENIKNDITDFYNYMQKNFGKIKFSNTGQAVDEAYMELSYEYPNLFPSSVINESDMFSQIMNIANTDVYEVNDEKLSKQQIEENARYVYDSIKEYQRQQRINKGLETNENGEYRPTRHEVVNKNREIARKLIGDITQIKDKTGWKYKINTMKRNLRDIMNPQQAQKMYDEYFRPITVENAAIEKDITRYNERIEKYNLSNEESTYVQMEGELKYNPETKLTSDIVNKYYEDNKYKIDKTKCNEAIETFRSTYDELLTQMNKVLVANGYDEIPYRKGYFPHFIEDKSNTFLGKIAEKMGWKIKSGTLPTDIAGITDQFLPGKTWTSFSQQRTGDLTDYNALKGFDNYIRAAMDVVHHTNSIQKLRALEAELRYQYSSDGVKEQIDKVFENKDLTIEQQWEEIERITDNVRNNPLGGFVSELKSYTNNLANKKSGLDRSMEAMFGRKPFSIMQNINSRVSANMVGANISSAVTNFIPITQAWSQVSTKNLMRGMYESIKNTIKNDGFDENSVYLTNRTQQADRLYKSCIDKINQKLGIPFEAIDSFTSNAIVRAKYYDNLQKGMTEIEAMNNADEFAKDVMAGRSKGDQPTIFDAKNPVAKLFTAFQLEVNNQFGYMFKDIPIDMADEAKEKLIAAFIKMFLGAWIYNEIFEKIKGRRDAFDPIDMAIESIETLGNEDLSLGEKIKNIATESAKEVPFVGNLLGGGRLPISSALPDVSNTWSYGSTLFSDADDEKKQTAIKGLTKELSKPVYYLAMPFGGGQLKKTIEGLSMYANETPGSYTNSGKLRFTADESPLGVLQSAVFGQYASKNARQYFDENRSPLSEKQVKEMNDLDIPIADYWKYKDSIKGLTKIEDKLNVINSSDFTTEQKNIMANNINSSKTDIDMNEYKDYGSYEEYKYARDNQAKYNTITKITDYDTYQTYKDNIATIKANTSNDKQETIQYINSLDLSIPQKAMFIKQYYKSFTQYDSQIVQYIDSLDISYNEKKEILNELGIKVK